MQSMFPKIEETPKAKEQNVFNTSILQDKFLSDRANFIFTGEKKLKIKPKNLDNLNLIPKDQFVVSKYSQFRNSTDQN